MLKPFFKTLLAVAVIFILTAPSLQADQLKPKKTVLLIHAFEPFMPYSVTVNQSIRTTLGADKTLHLDLYPEYLDLSRFPDETYRQRLLGHLRYKYAKRAPDLIFIMLNPAFDFVLGNIEKLFPHAPIVLCSVEKYQIEGRILRPNITGVLMAIDPKGTIDAALRLQPETKKVVVVAGIQKNDKVYEGVVRHALKEYEGRLQITYLTGVPLGIVLETVSGLSKDTIVFYITIFQDGTGKSYVPRDIATIVSRTSSVPVYAMFDSYFGYGIVGGHLVSFEKQGEKAAEIGLRILHGEKPNNIPMTPGAHVYKFDWREMKRWNISEANLPPGSIVEYRDFTTWERYRWQIIGIILFAIIESLLIVVLLIQRIKRRKAEKALFASEQKYRSIFENSIEGIYQSTPEGRLLTVNPALAHMHGYSSVSEMMQDVADSVEALYVNNEDRKKYQDIIREQEFIREFETELYRKDGSTFLASRNARIIRDNEGKVIYYEGIIQDVTERRKLENQLRQSQKMEAIGQLAGGIAHDFNNILTVIIGLGELVRMKIGVEYPLRGYMDQIMASAEKAAKLTQSLLAFSRQHKINLEPHNMDQIVESSGILLKRLLTEDIRLEIRLNSDDATIMADTTQIGLVLINLATNARDAMPRGGELHIETKTANLDDSFIEAHGYGKSGRYLLLSVADNGMGMDETTKKHIFDPFFTTKEVGRGTGLGLSIVYGIVKQHNGFINVYSEPGKGTEFRVYLPLTDMEIPYEKTLEGGISGGNETILIAEDDPGVRWMTVEILHGYGYNVIEAVDGEEAIRVFAENKDKIDLVILDVVMPKKNGREASEGILKIDPHAKIIFTSGYTGDVILAKGIENEKVDFISKPLSPDLMERKIREVLDR